MSKYYASEPCLTVDKIQYRDCISGMHALPGDSIDCIIADPPFGLSFTGKESIYNRDDRYVRSGYQEARGDYAEFSKKWIAVLPRIMKPTSTAWIFSGWTNLIDILNAARDAKLIANQPYNLEIPIWRIYTEKICNQSLSRLVFLKD